MPIKKLEKGVNSIGAILNKLSELVDTVNRLESILKKSSKPKQRRRSGTKKSTDK